MLVFSFCWFWLVFLSPWYFLHSCCYQEAKGIHQECYENQYWQKRCQVIASQQCLTLFLVLFFFNSSISLPLTPANSFHWCTEDDAFAILKYVLFPVPFQTLWMLHTQLKCNNNHKQNKKRQFMKPKSKIQLLLCKEKNHPKPKQPLTARRF